MLTVRTMNSSEREEVAALIFNSTNAWYQKNRGVDAFADPAGGRQIVDTYELLDPACTLVVYDDEQKRIAGNASDNRLRIVEPVDLPELLNQIPTCKIVVATGQKALDEILRQAGTSCARGEEGVMPSTKSDLKIPTSYQEPTLSAPAIGESIQITFNARPITLFRMPSTSRAYPKPLTYKADMYRRSFREGQ